MIKKFFVNVSKNFCVYLLAILNLMHAIEKKDYDWLLWISLTLVLLSLILDFSTALKGDAKNG